jgi:tRNA A37 N6-isopentenylltransferase MiaA
MTELRGVFFIVGPTATGKSAARTLSKFIAGSTS